MSNPDVAIGEGSSRSEITELNTEVLGNLYGFLPPTLLPPLEKPLTEMISFHNMNLSTVASAPDKRLTQTRISQ